jgi:hypothetical protein
MKKQKILRLVIFKLESAIIVGPEGANWQTIAPVLEMGVGTALEADYVAQCLADTNGCKCRWNWENSFQGQYVHNVLQSDVDPIIEPISTGETY